MESSRAHTDGHHLLEYDLGLRFAKEFLKCLSQYTQKELLRMPSVDRSKVITGEGHTRILKKKT